MNVPPPRHPSGGAAPVPYDRSAAARATLHYVAEAIAPSMVPVAELVPNAGITLNNLAAPVGTSPAIPLQWTTDGFIVAIRAETTDGVPASMSGVLLRLQLNGQDDFWNSGQGAGAGFASLSLISGVNSTAGRYPIRKNFLQANQGVAFLQNVTGGALVVNLLFDIIDTRDPKP